MKQRKILIVLGLIVILVVIAKLLYDSFLIRTPIGYAEKKSGLTLPKEIKLVKFDDNWQNANGDGSSYIEFELTDNDVENLKLQCLKNRYSSLPIKENGYDPFFSKKVGVGYYKLKLLSNNDRSHEIVILDVIGKRLYIMVESV